MPILYNNREVNGGQNCMVWRPFLLEVVLDRLGKEGERCRWRGGRNLRLGEYAIYKWGLNEQEPERRLERSKSQRMCMSCQHC